MRKDMIKDIAVATLIAIFLGFLGLSFLSPILLIVPALGIYIGVKHGEKYSIIVNGIFILTLSVFFGLDILILGCIFTGVSYISSNSIRRGEAVSSKIVKSTAYTFIIVLIFMAVVKLAYGINLVEMVNQKNSAMFSDMIKQVKNMNMYSSEQITQLESVKGTIGNIFSMNFPVILLSFAFILGTVSNGIASYFLRKREFVLLSPMRISRFRISIKFSTAALMIFIFTFFIKGVNPGIYEMLVSNLTIIFYFILFLQGLGVMSFWMERAKLPSGARIAILLFCVISVYLSALASLIGAVDLIFNFRKLRES